MKWKYIGIKIILYILTKKKNIRIIGQMSSFVVQLAGHRVSAFEAKQLAQFFMTDNVRGTGYVE